MKNLLLVTFVILGVACGGRENRPAAKPPVDSKSTPQVPADSRNLETKDGNPADTSAGGQQQQPAPEEVKITAHSEKKLRAVPTSQDSEIMIGTLEGELTVDAMEPANANARLLVNAESVAVSSPDLGKCRLEAVNFTEIKEGKIKFTLIGTDKKSELPGGCFEKLVTMAEGGFVVQFNNVPTDRLSLGKIKTVYLKVVIK